VRFDGARVRTNALRSNWAVGQPFNVGGVLVVAFRTRPGVAAQRNPMEYGARRTLLSPRKKADAVLSSVVTLFSVGGTMQFETLQKPDFTMLKATLGPAESLVVESGAMVARDSTVQMKTAMKGGMLAAAKRKMLGGESLFLNTFTGGRAGDTLYLAPAPEGDVLHQKMDGARTLYVQNGCFMAATPGVTLDTKWGGAKGFFSGAGLFLLKCTGVGDLFLSAYGAVHEVTLSGAPYKVDTGHILAFDSSLEWTITKVGGLKGLLFSGEGLVCEFRGHGRVWIQTRNPSSLAAWIHPFRRVKAKSN
jgi:uncharacterized protein (TIGR00266 family)